MGRVQAQVRASLLKQMLAGIDSLGMDVSTRARALIPGHIIRQLDEASRIDWVPMELNVPLVEAVEKVLGTERAQAHWRRDSTRILESPLMGPVTHGVMSLLKLSPETLFGFAPKSFSLIYRGPDIVVTGDGPARLRLRYRGLPEEVAASSSWRTSCAASLEAVFLLARVKGEIVVSSFDPPRGEIELVATWQPRP
jgi:hypothetical protein